MKHWHVLFVSLVVAGIAPAYAADAPSLDAAIQAYDAKDYGKCADTLAAVDAAPAGLPNGMDLFYVECLAAAGRTDAAFAVLDKQLPQGRIDVEDLKHKDRPGLNKLRTASGWATMLAKAERLDAARQARIDQSLRQELLARVEKDQAVRQKVIAEGAGGSWEHTVPVDRDNTAWLKKVVMEKGWPTKSMVGEDGSKAAFLIAQHATLDPTFQEQVLAQMQAALAQKEADPADFALLKDRVLLHQGKPQRYGTQFGTDPDGTMFLDNTQDLDGLDARRQAMGLPPIADYKKTLSELYHVKVR
ncbi:DUF6624 domain-containing protein [Xanthomonas graminis]|uniref:Secreted protein n=1 Tax=Xanthomonas graminis pv. poae TaxID=227946 RepID=A0A199PAB7_9XANT|nr:DUF6624 domain-containing protein [Xanthomonas translucens]OAX57950.1 hypothetical protein A6R73_08335 [Xanthomonas translucens pv. poae]